MKREWGRGVNREWRLVESDVKVQAYLFLQLNEVRKLQKAWSMFLIDCDKFDHQNQLLCLFKPSIHLVSLENS